MPKPKKFCKGENIKTVTELIGPDCEWIYWREKVMYFSFLWSMPFRVVVGAINEGIIYKAIRNE